MKIVLNNFGIVFDGIKKSKFFRKVGTKLSTQTDDEVKEDIQQNPYWNSAKVLGSSFIGALVGSRYKPNRKLGAVVGSLIGVGASISPSIYRKYVKNAKKVKKAYDNHKRYRKWLKELD